MAEERKSLKVPFPVGLPLEPNPDRSAGFRIHRPTFLQLSVMTFSTWMICGRCKISQITTTNVISTSLFKIYFGFQTSNVGSFGFKNFVPGRIIFPFVTARSMILQGPHNSDHSCSIIVIRVNVIPRVFCPMVKQGICPSSYASRMRSGDSLYKFWYVCSIKFGEIVTRWRYERISDGTA